LRELGRELMKSSPLDFDLYFTHTHWDHVAGLPFFAPAFNPKNRIRLWAGHLLPEQTLENVLVNLMMAPLFPVPLDLFRGSCTFNDFACGADLSPHPGIRIRTGPLNHPNRACGYRVEFDGGVFALITDTEHKGDELDQNVLDLAHGADVMVYDAMYSDEDYALRYKGWGHSTWQHALRIADAAGVRTAVLFHHDPLHADDALDRIAAAASLVRPGTLVAREGMTLQIR
jgi:phosphoribosyl 1,2-cyclic phosphodiesterase